jgi:Holliday junction resolvasome RuvABC endonuclease subunit
VTRRKAGAARPVRRRVTTRRKIKRNPKKALKRFRPEELPRMSGRLLALDVSSVTVGWAVFDDSALLRFGKWHPPGDDGTHAERLSNYLHWLELMLEEWDVDLLVVERPYSARNRKAFFVLSRYFGVAEIAHWRYFAAELPDEQSIQPKAVKDELGAVRDGLTYEGRKKLMVDIVNDLYDLHLKYKPRSKQSDDDVADAIAVGHAWLSRLKRKETKDE